VTIHKAAKVKAVKVKSATAKTAQIKTLTVEGAHERKERLAVRREKGLRSLEKGLKNPEIFAQFSFLSDRAFKQNISRAYGKVLASNGSECLLISGLFGMLRAPDGKTELGLVFAGEFGQDWLKDHMKAATPLQDGSMFVSSTYLEDNPPPFMSYGGFDVFKDVRLLPLPDAGFLFKFCAAACLLSIAEAKIVWGKDNNSQKMNEKATSMASRVLLARIRRRYPQQLERAFMKLFWKNFVDRPSVRLASRVLMQRRISMADFITVSKSKDELEWWNANHQRLMPLLSYVPQEEWCHKDLKILSPRYCLGSDVEINIFNITSDEGGKPKCNSAANPSSIFIDVFNSALNNWPAMALVNLPRICDKAMLALEVWRAGSAPSPRAFGVMSFLCSGNKDFNGWLSRNGAFEAIPFLGNAILSAEKDWSQAFSGRCPIKRNDCVPIIDAWLGTGRNYYKGGAPATIPMSELPEGHTWKIWKQHAALNVAVSSPAALVRHRL
jgi:hypothetical protein